MPWSGLRLRRLVALLRICLSERIDEGAGVYEEYLKVLHVSEKGGDAAEATETAKDLGRSLVEMQKDESLMIRVAATEMSQEVEKAVQGFARRLGRDVSIVFSLLG